MLRLKFPPITIVFLLMLSSLFSEAQSLPKMDTITKGNVTFIKDSRLEDLAKKELYFNEQLLLAPKNVRGFRLLLLSTNDRSLAMKLRSQLLQRFPDYKIYMSYQSPNIKLKFGDFLEKAEAENLKQQIVQLNLVNGNIYVVPEMIEVKAEKNSEKKKDAL